MIKAMEIHGLLKSIAVGHIADNNIAALQRLCAANSMTPMELFTRFILLESVGEVGQMGE